MSSDVVARLRAEADTGQYEPATAATMRTAAARLEELEGPGKYDDVEQVKAAARDLPDGHALAQRLHTLAATGPLRGVDRDLLIHSADALEALREQAWDALHSLSHAIRHVHERDEELARRTPGRWAVQGRHPIELTLLAPTLDAETTTALRDEVAQAVERFANYGMNPPVPVSDEHDEAAGVDFPSGASRDCALHAAGLMGEAAGVLRSADESAATLTVKVPEVDRENVAKTVWMGSDLTLEQGEEAADALRKRGLVVVDPSSWKPEQTPVTVAERPAVTGVPYVEGLEPYGGDEDGHPHEAAGLQTPRHSASWAELVALRRPDLPLATQVRMVHEARERGAATRRFAASWPVERGPLPMGGSFVRMGPAGATWRVHHAYHLEDGGVHFELEPVAPHDVPMSDPLLTVQLPVHELGDVPEDHPMRKPRSTEPTHLLLCGAVKRIPPDPDDVHPWPGRVDCVRLGGHPGEHLGVLEWDAEDRGEPVVGRREVTWETGDTDTFMEAPRSVPRDSDEGRAALEREGLNR